MKAKSETLAAKVRKAKKFLAQRSLPNTQAVDSTKPGYLADRFQEWKEARTQATVTQLKRTA